MNSQLWLVHQCLILEGKGKSLCPHWQFPNSVEDEIKKIPLPMWSFMWSFQRRDDN
jgi:hypothetical protein